MICVAFDVDASKVDVERKPTLPEALDLRDSTLNEAEITERLMSVGDAVPYLTSAGVRFCDRAYLSPFVDARNLRLFERVTKDGVTYFAIKNGFVLIGAIVPVALTDSFIQSLKTLYQSCAATFAAGNDAGAVQMTFEDVK